MQTGERGTTPESFAQLQSKLITPEIISGVKTLLRDAPTKFYEVFRQTPNGITPQQISLPQAIAELTDQLKIHAEILKLEMRAIAELSHELQENRKIGSKLLKRQKLKDEEDED